MGRRYELTDDEWERIEKLFPTAHTGRPAKCERKKRAVNSEYNQFIGTSRGGKNTKIHALVDGLGNPISFLLSGG